MVDVLRFTLDSFGHFVGVCFLISLCGFWIAVISVHIGKIARPHKRVTHSYENYTSTHKLG